MPSRRPPPPVREKTHHTRCRLPHRSQPAKLQRERLLNLREIGNYLARVQLNHCDELQISEGCIPDAKLIEINETRKKVFEECEFGEETGAPLPLVLTKSHLVTWCFGELPIAGDSKEFFKIKGFATESTRADDVAAFLKFEGTKYDKHLAPADREAADLLRRAVTRGPDVYVKPREAPGASPTRHRHMMSMSVEDSELLDKLMATNEKGKSKYLCDTAFKHRMGIRIMGADGSEVDLTRRGAIIYQYTHAKLVKSIVKFNALLSATAKRKRGKAGERFPSAERLAKRAAKAARRGTRPRTNTAKVEAAQARLAEVCTSRIHRTEQRDAARAKAHARKLQIVAILDKLESMVGEYELDDLKQFVALLTKDKVSKGGNQYAKLIKLFRKKLEVIEVNEVEASLIRQLGLDTDLF